MMGYALAHRAGIRRYGVGSHWYEQNWIGSLRYAGVQGMADTWKKAPVVFEWSRGLGRTWPLLSAAPSGRVSTPISAPPRPAKGASRVGCFAGATQQLAAILAGLPESQTLKKFLASKIRPGHCGCAAILELVEAA